MFQLTKKGREVADALDQDPEWDSLFSNLIDWTLDPYHQICLNWLRGRIGPRLMSMAIHYDVVNLHIPKALKELVEKGLVEEVE